MKKLLIALALSASLAAAGPALAGKHDKDGKHGKHEAARGGHYATLVLLRHGQSQWNLENRFTGWSDVALTEKGEEGAAKAGRLMKKEGLVFDKVHTSVLQRAVKTSWIALEAMGQTWVPEKKSWRLNERCYDVPPPPLARNDPRSPANDIRYAKLKKGQIPQAESLKDVIERVRPYWKDEIADDLEDGKTVLVVGHSTQLRALSSLIEPGLDQQQLQKLEIGNTKPIVYKLDRRLNVLDRQVLGAKKDK